MMITCYYGNENGAKERGSGGMPSSVMSGKELSEEGVLCKNFTNEEALSQQRRLVDSG